MVALVHFFFFELIRVYLYTIRSIEENLKKKKKLLKKQSCKIYSGIKRWHLRHSKDRNPIWALLVLGGKYREINKSIKVIL